MFYFWLSPLQITLKSLTFPEWVIEADFKCLLLSHLDSQLGSWRSKLHSLKAPKSETNPKQNSQTNPNPRQIHGKFIHMGSRPLSKSVTTTTSRGSSNDTCSEQLTTTKRTHGLVLDHVGLPDPVARIKRIDIDNHWHQKLTYSFHSGIDTQLLTNTSGLIGHAKALGMRNANEKMLRPTPIPSWTCWILTWTTFVRHCSDFFICFGCHWPRAPHIFFTYLVQDQSQQFIFLPI